MCVCVRVCLYIFDHICMIIDAQCAKICGPLFGRFHISRTLVLQVALAFRFRADEAQAGEQIHQAICKEL